VSESADSRDVRLQVVTVQAVGRQRQLGGGNTRCPAEALTDDVTNDTLNGSTGPQWNPVNDDYHIEEQTV